MKRFLPLLIVGLLMAGCNPGARLAAWSDTCVHYGFRHGTAAHAMCVQKEELAWQEGISRNLQGLSQSLQMMTAPASRTQFCTTTLIGSQAYTMCQ